MPARTYIWNQALKQHPYVTEKTFMSTSVRAPQQLPDMAPEPQAEIPSKWWALFGLCCVAVLGFVLGSAAWNARSDEPPGPQAQAAIGHVDQTVRLIASGEWERAYEAFDRSCSSFGLPEFRAGFAPVFASYRSHTLSPPEKEPFEDDQIVLVRGMIDLGSGADNSLRAELWFDSAGGTAAMWRLCGLRIDES